MDLFNPDFHVKIGMYTLDKGIEVETSSAIDSITDWCKLSIQDDVFSKLPINKNDLVDVFIGYEGQNYNIFAGNIEQISSTEVMCRDDMTKLTSTRITETFMDVTPQDIISFCLNKTRISNMDISADNYTVKSMFAINNKSITDVLKQINSAWNIQYKFYFRERTFYWQKEHEQNKKIFKYTHGENIISLKNVGGWMLESVTSPFIRHSDIISIDHPMLSGQFKVRKIQNKYQEGYTRSYIYV